MPPPTLPWDEHPESRPRRAPRFSLTIQSGFQAGAVFQYRGGRVTIGTHHRNDIQLHEPTVSGFHCEVECVGDRIVVRDLHSLNGTYVDGVRVRETVLSSGEALRVGTVILGFERT